MTTLNQWLFPPLEPAEQRRRGRLFNTINNVQIAGVTILALTGIATSFGSPLAALSLVGPCLPLLAILIAASALVRRGFYYFGVMLSWGAVVAVLAFVVPLQGARDMVTFLAVWPIVVAAMLLAPRMGFWVAGLMAAMLTFFSLAELFQWLPLPLVRRDLTYPPYWEGTIAGEIISDTIGDVMVRVVVFGLVAFMFWLVTTSLRRAIQQSRQVVTRLDAWADDNVDVATRITDASIEIETTMRQQETGAAQQAIAVETIAESVRALWESARKIADRSSVVADNAGKSLEHNDRIVERVKTLADQTRRITEILHVMKRIANKSDLLALNAALEGVKAGTRGRGFVLVASEVRRLAEDVLSSVRDIRELTQDIEGSTQAVKASSQDGAALADKTAELTKQISLITKQQEEGTEMLSESMQSIAAILRQTVSATSQVADSTKTLGSLAESIRDLARQRDTLGPSSTDPNRAAHS